MKHRITPRAGIAARFVSAAALGALVAATACSKREKELAPEASALAQAKPVTEAAATYVIDAPSSNVSFEMPAELEKITGRAPGSAEGELFVDAKDVTTTRGLFKVDLLKLSIYQRKRESADAEYGEEQKNDKQNGHMRTWFQISEDAPAEVREANRFAEFKIKKVESTSARDVTALKGPQRRITANVVGDFRLHGRVTEQRIPVEVVFQFDGDKPTALSIRTAQPFGVELEKYDVHPRKAFDQLADATLETLGQKVNKVPEVSFEVRATAK